MSDVLETRKLTREVPIESVCSNNINLAICERVFEISQDQTGQCVLIEGEKVLMRDHAG
jgi:hypothetical protein